jgi:hypothetical protein
MQVQNAKKNLKARYARAATQQAATRRQPMLVQPFQAGEEPLRRREHTLTRPTLTVQVREAALGSDLRSTFTRLHA